MEWAPTVIAAIAAAVSVLGAWQATAATRERREGRRVLGKVMRAGSEVVEDIRGHRIDDDEAGRRYVAWDHEAAAAVEAVDEAQLSRYHAPIPGSPSHAEATLERIRRLQEIQDKL